MFDHGFLPIPGWGLSVVWLAHDGLPNKGILTLEFFSGNGANMQGCLVDRRLRSILCSVVLVAQRDVMLEFKVNKQENFAVAAEKAEAVAKAAAAVALAAATSARVRTSSYGRSSKSPTLTRGSSKMNFKTTTGTGTATSTGTGSRTDSPVGDTTEENTADGFEGEDTFGKESLVAFTRAHAVASLAGLAAQAPRMAYLYYDDKQQKIVMPYTIRDANAHLKTVNIEWSYSDGDNSKPDPWRM